MSNVDQQEIDKFSALAAKWWDPDGEFKSLHDINPLRVDLAQKACGGLFSKTVLDVGCGGGIFAEALAAREAKVSAIDMASASLDVARLHLLESGLSVDYQLSTAENYAQQHPSSFDLVTCLEMLEHVPQPQQVVEACAELAKPDGTVIFSTINRTIKSHLMAIIAAEYLFDIIPKGTHQFDKFIKPSQLRRWIEASGLRVESATGLHFNPLTQQYYLSNANIDVNYFLICRKK